MSNTSSKRSGASGVGLGRASNSNLLRTSSHPLSQEPQSLSQPQMTSSSQAAQPASTSNMPPQPPALDMPEQSDSNLAALSFFHSFFAKTADTAAPRRSKVQAPAEVSVSPTNNTDISALTTPPPGITPRSSSSSSSKQSPPAAPAPTEKVEAALHRSLGSDAAGSVTLMIQTPPILKQKKQQQDEAAATAAAAAAIQNSNNKNKTGGSGAVLQRLEQSWSAVGPSTSQQPTPRRNNNSKKRVNAGTFFDNSKTASAAKTSAAATAAAAGVPAGEAGSPSRTIDASQPASPDYVPVQDDKDYEIYGTPVPSMTKLWGRLQKQIQKLSGGNQSRESPTNNLGSGLISPATAAQTAAENGDVASKVPATQGASGVLQWVVASVSSAGVFHVALFAAMAFGLVYGVYANRFQLTDVDLIVDWSLELNVAFIGNAYFFVNDVPRLMEAISDRRIHQQSVLHSSAGSLAGILLTGSGMYKQWTTDEALLVESYTNSYGNNKTVYDYGLCTVAQILLGYDEILSYRNRDGAYYNDGKNPCIMDETYLEYVDYEILDVANENSTYGTNWDYVVLVDQTKRMAIPEARQETIYSLANAYGPLLNASGAIPVIVDTHSFWSQDTNMTGLVSVEYFQSLIYDGVEEYVNALAAVLPDWQSPVVAPIGIAYLTVYDERPKLWQKLFIEDMMHSSVAGSYLFACVLYATMYGHLPDKHSTVRQKNVEYLFAESRKLVGRLDYPTESEAYYYRNVARRVALRGYVPNSLRNA